MSPQEGDEGVPTRVQKTNPFSKGGGKDEGTKRRLKNDPVLGYFSLNICGSLIRKELFDSVFLALLHSLQNPVGVTASSYVVRIKKLLLYCLAC